MTNVFAQNVSADVTIGPGTERRRLRGLHVTSKADAAGQIVFSTGGAAVFRMDLVSGNYTDDVAIPVNGVVFTSGMHVDIPTSVVALVFYD